MSRDIKIKYVILRHGMEPYVETFYLDEIERGTVSQIIYNEMEAGYGYEVYKLQYTGLKDKAGVEIYEGDKVKFDTPELYARFEKVGTVKHVTDYGTSRFIIESDGMMYDVLDGCEVVGNVWQEEKE